MCILETFLDVKIFEWLQIFLVILNCYLIWKLFAVTFLYIFEGLFKKSIVCSLGKSYYNLEAFRRAFLSTRILTEVRVFLSILQN